MANKLGLFNPSVPKKQLHPSFKLAAQQVDAPADERRLRPIRREGRKLRRAVPNHRDELLALLAVANSRPFSILVELQLAAADAAARSYEVGVIQKTPIPPLAAEKRQQLATLSRRAWSLKRTLDTVTETSHAFLLPAALRLRVGDYDPPAIEEELANVQADIDGITFDLYAFSEADRQAAMGGVEEGEIDEVDEEDEDEDEAEVEVLSTDAVDLAKATTRGKSKGWSAMRDGTSSYQSRCPDLPRVM
jgi:hypothetical protein